MVFKWREGHHTVLVLEVLKNEECLWNTKSPFYRNQHCRNRALENMVKRLKIPGVTPVDVKLKLKSIRTRYSSELGKILHAERFGMLYTPKLFWFPHADSFLRNVCNPRTSPQNKRTVNQLKKLWENIKFRQKAELAEERKNLIRVDIKMKDVLDKEPVVIGRYKITPEGVVTPVPEAQSKKEEILAEKEEPKEIPTSYEFKAEQDAKEGELRVIRLRHQIQFDEELHALRVKEATLKCMLLEEELEIMKLRTEVVAKKLKVLSLEKREKVMLLHLRTNSKSLFKEGDLSPEGKEGLERNLHINEERDTSSDARVSDPEETTNQDAENIMKYGAETLFEHSIPSIVKLEPSSDEDDYVPEVVTSRKRSFEEEPEEVCSTTLGTKSGVISEFDAVGINVAKKLAKMKPTQALFAESLISTVLRKGLLNQLEEDTNVCNYRGRIIQS